MNNDFIRRQDNIRAHLANIENSIDEIKDTILAASVSCDKEDEHYYDKAIKVCNSMAVAILRGHKDLNDIAQALGGGDDKDPPDGP